MRRDNAPGALHEELHQKRADGEHHCGFGERPQISGRNGEQRRHTIIVAALLAIPAAYLWAFSETAMMLAIGAFLMQFFVQGAWGVIPAHLNELSPADARGTFPGTVYQLGNFIASYNAVLQTSIAVKSGENYSIALAGVAVAAAIAIIVLTALGREAREVDLSAS